MPINYDTKTKFLSSEMQGSLDLKNVYGSLNNLLKNVLINGFNIKTILSITYFKNTEEAIIKLPLNHGYTYNQVIQLEGVTPSSYNNQYRILEVTSETLKIKVSGVPEGIPEVTGATVKIAPLGYSIIYENESEGVICFKNNSIKSPAILKVIDKIPPNGYLTTWAKYARVVMGQEIDAQGNFIGNIKNPVFISSPDIENTGNGVSGATGIHGFAKWDYAIHSNSHSTEESRIGHGTYPTDWRIIGDDKTFYLMIRSQGRGNNFYSIVGFGNYISDDNSETTNVCLQARDGGVAANDTSGYSYARTRNQFGALDATHGGFLFSNVYGKTTSLTSYGKYRCEGLSLSSVEPSMPWKSSEIKSLNPSSGNWITSHIYIKDSDNYLRGYHRGIKMLYGKETLPEGTAGPDGSLLLYVQTPYFAATTLENMPLLFTLKDWEHIE